MHAPKTAAAAAASIASRFRRAAEAITRAGQEGPVDPVQKPLAVNATLESITVVTIRTENTGIN